MGNKQAKSKKETATNSPRSKQISSVEERDLMKGLSRYFNFNKGVKSFSTCKAAIQKAKSPSNAFKASRIEKVSKLVTDLIPDTLSKLHNIDIVSSCFLIPNKNEVTKNINSQLDYLLTKQNDEKLRSILKLFSINNTKRQSVSLSERIEEISNSKITEASSNTGEIANPHYKIEKNKSVLIYTKSKENATKASTNQSIKAPVRNIKIRVKQKDAKSLSPVNKVPKYQITETKDNMDLDRSHKSNKNTSTNTTIRSNLSKSPDKSKPKTVIYKPDIEIIPNPVLKDSPVSTIKSRKSPVSKINVNRIKISPNILKSNTQEDLNSSRVSYSDINKKKSNENSIMSSPRDKKRIKNINININELNIIKEKKSSLPMRSPKESHAPEASSTSAIKKLAKLKELKINLNIKQMTNDSEQVINKEYQTQNKSRPPLTPTLTHAADHYDLDDNYQSNKHVHRRSNSFGTYHKEFNPTQYNPQSEEGEKFSFKNQLDATDQSRLNTEGNSFMYIKPKIRNTLNRQGKLLLLFLDL